MKTKLRFSILTLLLFLLAGRFTEASRSESVKVDIAENISNYETRLQKIEQRLEQVDSPIQQMGTPSAEVYETGVNDIQLSLDEVNERLAMIRFVVNHDGSAPQDKRDLAQAELSFMEAELAELESQSSSLVNEIDEVVWY